MACPSSVIRRWTTQDKTRQDKTRQNTSHKTRHKTRHMTRLKTRHKRRLKTRHKTKQDNTRPDKQPQDNTQQVRTGQDNTSHQQHGAKFKKVSGRREGKIPLFGRRCRLLLAERMFKKKTLYQLKKFGHCKCILFTIAYKT